MLTIEHDRQTIRILWEGHLLLRYRLVSAVDKPHFDRIALPARGQGSPTAIHGGWGPRDAPEENLVLAGPHNGPCDLGLFFTPGHVDEVDFRTFRRSDFSNKPPGACCHAGGLTTTVRDDGCVCFSHDIEWRRHEDEVWLQENRQITVHPPAADGYRIDWLMSWSPVGADRTLSSRADGLGYAGLYFRAPRSMEGRHARVLNSQGGRSVEAIDGHPARWADFSGKLDGLPDETRWSTAGIALMDHPTNPRHPVKWSILTQPYAFISADPTFDDPWLLKIGQPITLRFAAFVHGGPADREALETEYRRFSSSD